MIFAILDHLWQSTLVVAVVALMAVVYRRSSAGIRYRLWLAASVKFLVPFAALNSFGKWLAPASPPAFDMTPGILLIQQAAQPVLEFPSSMEQAVTAFHPTLILETVWAVGFLAVATAWLVRWLRVRAIVRSARQLGWTGPVPIMSSATLIEPVLVGIRRAVLLVPERLPDHLTQPQIEAILAHEFCHLRRRDNLTATIHMLVEALFWFYPLIWWIGARMIAERERACDEAVVGAGHDPEAYARGILETCRLYLQSPLACAAGASGSNLKKRLEMIMTAYPSRPLGLTARSFLVGVGVCALASPVAAGLLGAPSGPIRAPQSIATSAAAESAAAPGPSTADVERLREEQQKPRQIVPFDPPKFDRYVGYYELASNFVFKVTRDGDKFFAQLTG